MFHAWGLYAYRWRKIIPAVIILLIGLLYCTAGLHLGDRMSQEGWDDPGSSSTRASAIEQEIFGRDNTGDVILLVTAPDGQTVNSDVIVGAMNSYLTDLQADYPDHIDYVNSYFEKRTAALATDDLTQAFAAVALAGDGEQTLKDFRAIENSLDALRDDPTAYGLPEGTTVEIAGATAVADALDEGMSGDIHRAEIVALPVVAILLIIVFGSVMAACMPLIVGILSIAGSLGVLSLLAEITQVNVFAQSVVTLLGLGLAIDYGLFMVSRFREELLRGTSVGSAVAATVATAGKTVVFSAAMVAVALSGLFVFPQAFLKSVAYGAISAVVLAALLSITVLPALFGMLGDRINWLSIRKTAHTDTDMDASPWARIPAFAMKHSKVVTVVVAGALLVLTLPLARVSFGGINETYLPPSNSVRVAQERFNDAFPNYRTEPIKLVITGADNQALVDIYQQANAIEGLTGRFSATHPTTDGTTILSTGIVDRSMNADVVDSLRSMSLPEGVTVYIGGTPAMEVESIEALFTKLPWMALYIIVATFILMALVFGSLILPAKAIIMTILGLGATLGILTCIFVDGFGASALNFTAGPLMSPVLVLIAAIVYGLSTDYEVFLVSRMVEARQRGYSTDRAIRYGTAHTGSIITAAALIMIVVCGAFGFSEIVMMKYIAFGMIAALLLDATVIRMGLVPAVMHLLREDNWWAPRWVHRVSAKLGHGGESAPSVPCASAPVPSYSSGSYDEDAAPEPITPVDAVRVDARPIRRNRSVDPDSDLIPFTELIRRLEDEEKNGES